MRGNCGAYYAPQLPRLVLALVGDLAVDDDYLGHGFVVEGVSTEHHHVGIFARFQVLVKK